MVAQRNSGSETLLSMCGWQFAIADDATFPGGAETCASIDRLGYQSCVIGVGWECVVSKDETLKITVGYQESSDNSSWGATTVLDASYTVAAGTALVTAFAGYTTHNLDLSFKKRYIRVMFTTILSQKDVAEPSAEATDHCIISASVALGGCINKPIHI